MGVHGRRRVGHGDADAGGGKGGDIDVARRPDLVTDGPVAAVGPDIMEDLASRMSEAYRELIFWIDLPILAEYAGIKKHKEVNEKTKE